MEVNVTKFVNPHLFWFFEVKNTPKRDAVELQISSNNVTKIASAQIGDFVAVYNAGWKRAVVTSKHPPYTCWLLDYGTEIQAKIVYMLPTCVDKIPLAKQGALIDTTCLQQVHTISGFLNIEKLEFTAGCIKRAQDYLEIAEKVFFSCSKEVNDVHLGTITIFSLNDTFDLTETLIKDNVLAHDKNLFKTAFSTNSMVDVKLSSLACSPKLKKFVEDEDFMVTGIGRGVSRNMQKSVNKRSIKKVALEEWVQQSKLAVNNEKNNFDSDSDTFNDNSSSSSQHLNDSQTVSLKHLREAYADVDSSIDSEDLLNSSNEKILKNHANVSKKSNQIDWNEFRSENSDKTKHLNILPSGMSLPKQTKTKSSNRGRRQTSSFTAKEVTHFNEKVPSSTSDSIKSPKEETAEVCKRLVSGCNCEQCVGWEGDDLYFNENKKQFQDTKCSRKTKEIVKPSLLLREGEAQNVVIKSCVTPLKTKIKRSSAPTVLVHGTTFLSPVTSLSAVPFHADIHKALRPFEHVYSVQSYVWPALMRHMNICIIGNQNSGKTMAYLPGICSFELERQERYPGLPHNTISPLTVILCSGVQTAEKVFNTVLKLLENASEKTYVALAVQPIDKKCLNQFQKRVDILVATPKTLTSLVSTRIITLKRLCHFIVEEADVVLEKFSNEIDSLLKLIQSMLMHRSCNYTVQMVVTAEHWTLPVEALLKSLAVVPVVCIGSYLEAALYGRVDLQLNFVESKMKMSTLTNLLKGKVEVCRTVVICNTNEEINAVKEYLLIGGVNCFFITDDMDSKDILEIESKWLHSSAGKHFALICSKRVFSHSINVTNAVLLVHYSLPDTWTQFVDRFRCLIDNYTSPLIKDSSDDWTRCKAHVFVDESCTKQFPKIVQVMQRLGAKLPNQFQDYYQEMIRNEENAKISATTKICNIMRLFGKCSLTQCKNRHFLSKDLDCNNSLPKSGLVKFKLVFVHDVTCFGIKLLEHTNSDGVTSKYHVDDDLETQLQEAMATQKSTVFDPKPGNRYAYLCPDKQKFYRCTVRKIVSFEKITKKPNVVSIRCLDTGAELDALCSCLYELPSTFSKINAQVVDVFLANLVPPDLDVAWSFYAKSKVEKILQDADYSTKNTYAMGQIQLQLGNVLWLKNILVYEVLESTNLTVNKLNLRKRLLDETLAVVNEAQLGGLRESCSKAKIELPDYTLSLKDSEIPLIKQAKPQWAHLDESPSIEVFIAYVETPSVFYVRLKKFYDLFLSLQKEIQEAISKPFYPPVTDVCLDRCYLAKDPEGDDYARVIVKEVVGDFIEVFFVDYGDHATLEKSELKHLPDEYISKLPFQVIECRLYGVEPIHNQWDLSAIHRFFEFVFEPNTDYFRTLYTTSCKHEPSTVTGGLKYSVLLIDNFEDVVIVNKLLIDWGEGAPIQDEELNAEFSLPTASEEEQIEAKSDIDDKEMTLEDIKNLQQKHGSKIRVVEATGIDDEFTWDIQINDAESFVKNLISGAADGPSTSTQSSCDLPTLQALPPSSYSTPNVIWHQASYEVRVNIMLPDINDCDLQVVREKLLLFKTVCNGKEYKLNLNLFDKVEKNFQYTLGGPHIRVTLKKKAATEWPRLIVSTQKVRYIKYDFTRCDYEEEQQRRFLDLGLEDDDEDIEDGIVYEIGSDDNYSESDYDSDYHQD